MSGLDVTVDTGGGILQKPIRRFRSFKPVMSGVVDYHRLLTQQEFDGGFFYALNGQRRPWHPTVPFGPMPSRPSKLTLTGALRRAYMGGPGSYARISDFGAQWGVLASRFPYAAHHRGGSGTTLRASEVRKVRRIRVTDKQRGFLAAAKGVRLKKTTKYLQTIPRPHAGRNPQVQTYGNAAMSSFVVRGVVPDPRRAIR